eukprot:7691365-Pyramimonas_sp.AAC.1
MKGSRITPTGGGHPAVRATTVYCLGCRLLRQQWFWHASPWRSIAHPVKTGVTSPRIISKHRRTSHQT